MSATTQLQIRDWLRDDDPDRMVELHRAVYAPEYGMNDVFLASVADGIRGARAAGWPERCGAVRLVDHGARLSGCAGLTDEGDGTGRIRWVVLSSELRGQGVGRQIISELIEHARGLGWRELRLETYSALTTAGRIYRSLGFTLASERPRSDWGPPIVYQHYVLDLG